MGETIKYEWIGEWWEGTKIANKLYVKIEPRPVQFRGLNNISKCASGYVGSVYKTNSSAPQSLLDIMKPYQYAYVLYMYRTELAFIKNKGKIPNLDLAKMVIEQLNSNEYTKSFAEVAKKAVAEVK